MVARTRSAAAHAPAPASTPHLVVNPASDAPRVDDYVASTDKSGSRRRTKDVLSGASSSGGLAGGEADELEGSSIAAEEDDDGAAMLRCGIALIAGSATCFALGLWSMLIGPLCAPTGIQLLDALVQDTHYKYLVVLLVPVTVCFVIVNWWGLKIFRHA
ncbi:hypothetical protein JCM9279_000563 [Rhodotorula babjevae]